MAAPKEDPAPSGPSKAQGDANDLAQAYRELLRGEQAATALEANLSNLESKLDALLAAYEPAETTEEGGKDSDSGEASKKTSEKKEKPAQESKEDPQDEKKP
ncbi:unnamed protein product [Clonostachys chloroleuca]|uniref:Uncharacterized protein n=1 Tax=Clonostachys chloroleuca TaxID=1926264 RepID=A0AA35LSF5_9HYPO|nr:unnamed protein product [Clonostachys chloroleuca]